MTVALTLEGLDAVLSVMRKHGVASFKTAVDGSPLEVEFTPAETPPSTLQPPDVPIPECECGHSVAEHNEEGACLRACPAEKCSL